MAGKSDFLENELLDHVLTNTAYTAPTTVYCALYTATPSDAGGGTEVTGNAYARTAITFATASGGSTDNSTAVTFPTPTPSGWGTVTHFGVFDASTAGNLLYWGSLTESKVVNSGDTVEFPANSLVITED